MSAARAPAGKGPNLIRVMIADSQRLFAEVLSSALGQSGDIKVLDDHPASGPEAAQMILKRQPDVAVLDHWMPGMDEAAVRRTLMGWIPKGHVIFLSWFHGAHHVARAIRLGAAAFIPKSAEVAEVAAAIRQAHAQNLPALTEQLENLLQTMQEREDVNRRICDHIRALTARELQIVRHLSTGRPVGEIAQQLGITSGTVKAHIRKILLKTQAQSQKQVIAMARFCGAID